MLYILRNESNQGIKNKGVIKPYHFLRKKMGKTWKLFQTVFIWIILYICVFTVKL